MYREDYVRFVLPFLKEEYFETDGQKMVYNIVSDYFDKYNALPSQTAMGVEGENIEGIAPNVFAEYTQLLADSNEQKDDLQYLIDTSEKFCKDRALYLALMNVIEVVEGEDQKEDMSSIGKFAIPDLLKDALGVTFDTKVGSEFVEDAPSRFDAYHDTQSKLSFDLSFLNSITDEGNGVVGIPNKTLSGVLGGSGSGKSALMTHLSSKWMEAGHNVLYISLELSEHMVMKRIDQNLMNITAPDLMKLSRSQYEKQIEKIKDKTVGKLVVKEYPTGGGHAGHFRHLLNELNTKQNFKPRVIVVDYLGICASSRMKKANAGTYEVQKSIAEELRSLAIEFDVPVFTGIQTNRGGVGASDLDMADIADSYGVAMTLDLLLGIITDDNLRENNQVILKSIKNRFGEIDKSSLVGIDYSKMLFYDVEDQSSSSMASIPSTSPADKFKSKSKSDRFKDFSFDS
jgi:hypothetical protein